RSFISFKSSQRLNEVKMSMEFVTEVNGEEKFFDCHVLELANGEKIIELLTYDKCIIGYIKMKNFLGIINVGTPKCKYAHPMSVQHSSRMNFELTLDEHTYI